MLLAEEIERLGGLFAQADDAARIGHAGTPSEYGRGWRVVPRHTRLLTGTRKIGAVRIDRADARPGDESLKGAARATLWSALVRIRAE
jgi:hypothetical protein